MTGRRLLLLVFLSVPVAGLALILGIDRFMSEARSLTNFIGNGVAAIVVARWENELDQSRLTAELSGRRSSGVTDAEHASFARPEARSLKPGA